MKCAVIYNPYAKKGNFEKNKDLITKALKQKFEVVDFIKSEYNKHTSQIAAFCCGNYDVIVAAGGDGTFNEVVNGIAQKENKPTVAFLPCGTVNDMAHSLGIPKNTEKALDIILNGTAFKHDAFKINDSYGIYVFTAGLFTSCTYKTNQEHKRRFGWFAYAFKGLTELFRLNNLKLEVKVDDKDYNGNFAFIMLANSNSVAGFNVNKGAALNDGLVDVVLMRQCKILGLTNLITSLRLIKLFLFGIKSFKRSKRVTVLNAKRVSIKNLSQSKFNLDGEFAGKEDEYNIELLKQEIEIFVPGKNPSTKNHLIKKF
ncbi:MAG: diacylglycerol kinase family protein [Spirochaetales bacterium]